MMRFLFLLVLAAAAVRGTALEEIELLRSRLAKVEAAGDAVDVSGFRPFAATDAVARAEAILSAQRADGSWAEVDYSGQARGVWTPAVGHLRERALFLARAYAQTQDARFAAGVRRALDWWAAAKPVCPNWWWNEIGAPLDFGTAAMLTDDTLSEADRRRYADYLECTQIKMTGQNRVWLSRVVLMRGILRRDAGLIDTAAKTISDEIVISTGSEGIAPDWCFRQHGPQLQFGNYGASFLMNMARLANAFATTRWAFSAEQLSILRQLGHDGFRWTLWNGFLDHSCLCRQIRPGEQRLKAAAIAGALRTLEAAGEPLPHEAPRGFKLFPSGAFAVYRPGAWMATVRMCTPAVLETETWVNGENTLGGHLADGALFTYVTGGEYEDVAPAWRNWRLIPGVTSYADLPPVRRNWPKTGANECDGISARTTGPDCAQLDFDFRRDGLSVHKRWEFSPEGIVCTGRGITATNASSRVVTCVEHALAWPDARALPYADGRLVVVNGPLEYIIEAPEPAIGVKIEERTGDWEGIDPGSVQRHDRVRVLEIVIDHGTAPQDAAYRYTIRPNPFMTGPAR